MSARRGWFKSSFSLSGVNCVEVRHLPDGGVVVRDTKAGGAGPVLSFTAGEWQAFMQDFDQTLAKFKVLPPEQAELKAIVQSTYADIVTGPR